LENLRFHDLRHTFATRLVQSGVDLITVRDLLGHFSISMTQRYTHTNRNQKINAVELLKKNKEEKEGKKTGNLLQ
jgi:site-specific recombinase XerD